MAETSPVQAEIRESQRLFDLGTPLTADELALFGFFVAPEPQKKSNEPTVELTDLDDVSFAPADVEDGSDPARYLYYLKCQALATLVAFDEGWTALEELALKAYVNARQRENANYRGDDPQRAFALRLRAQVAEDFWGFIRAVVNEAINAPKPTLKKET